MTEFHDVAVVGAGITGLAAAFELRRAGKTVVVLEAAARVGGSISTLRDGDWRIELGPNTVVDGAALHALIDAAGLGGERLEASSGVRRRYLWHRGRLRALPANPLSLLRSPLLSMNAKWRVLREPRAPEPPAREESVADFARRRLGAEVLSALVEPMVAGVYAGDAERLSLRWAFPRIAAMEREHGSLLRAARRGKGAKRTVVTLRDGLESLPLRLAGRCGEVRTQTPALEIRPADGGFALATPAGQVRARQVVLATPASVTGQLLAGSTAGRSTLLGEVEYASAAVVALGFRGQQVGHPLDGFGFLAPRGGGLRIRGCVFASSLFAGRAPAGHVQLTAILGGRLDEEAATWDDGRLREVTLGDLRRALGIVGEPVIAVVRRWPRAIAQPELGHARFVQRVDELRRALPGLEIAGSFLGGAAVADCAEDGVRAARGLLEGGGA